MSKISNINYVIGDLHFGDEALFTLVYGNTFLNKEEYAEVVVANYNKVVHNDAVVLFLGDLGRRDALKKYLPRLNGYKILILGNHDTYAKKFYGNYFAEIYNHPLFVHNRIVFSHEPIPVEPGVINIHGHTHHVFLKSEQHFNYCIEHTNYAPVKIKIVEDLLSNITPPNRKFLYEWYKDQQIWTGKNLDRLVLDEERVINVEATREVLQELRKKQE